MEGGPADSTGSCKPVSSRRKLFHPVERGLAQESRDPGCNLSWALTIQRNLVNMSVISTVSRLAGEQVFPEVFAKPWIPESHPDFQNLNLERRHGNLRV
jgi:hypothetical protein